MENPVEDKRDTSPQQEEMHVLQLIGGFLVFFAVLLLIAMMEQTTRSARLTNLFSSLILMAAGTGMFLRGAIRHRGAWWPPIILFAVLAGASVVVALCLSPSSSQARAGAYVAVVDALKSAGFWMRGIAASAARAWVAIFSAIGFLIIAAVVWLVHGKTVFEGAPDRKRWRDIRLWTVVVMVAQAIIYFLLGD